MIERGETESKLQREKDTKIFTAILHIFHKFLFPAIVENSSWTYIYVIIITTHIVSYHTIAYIHKHTNNICIVT